MSRVYYVCTWTRNHYCCSYTRVQKKRVHTIREKLEEKQKLNNNNNTTIIMNRWRRRCQTDNGDDGEHTHTVISRSGDCCSSSSSKHVPPPNGLSLSLARAYNGNGHRVRRRRILYNTSGEGHTAQCGDDDARRIWIIARVLTNYTTCPFDLRDRYIKILTHTHTHYRMG